MTPERWRKIEAIFIEADAVPPAGRPAVLDRVCPDAPAARPQVAQRPSRAPTRTSLNAPTHAQVGRAFDSEGFVHQPRCGRYQLGRRIGPGRMGVVYEANRVDDFQ